MNASTRYHEDAGQYGGRAQQTGDLEREGDEIRADLDRTLDALGGKLEPGQIMDRSIQMLRENGAELVHEVGATVRNHPIPVCLTAAGLVWLTASMVARHGAHDDVPSRAPRAHGRRSRASTTMDETRRELSHAADTVRARAGEAQDHFTQMVREQPLVLGALAVAAGALIGAALPMTQYENRIVGPLHDRTMAKADEVGRRQYEKVREKFDGNADAQRTGDTDEPLRNE